MENTFHCPVCGKTGIEDYHNKDIICPCCGSDLSIFKTIESLPEELPKGNSAWKAITAVACVMVICLAVLCYSYRNTVQQNKSQMEKDSQTIVECKDRLLRLETQLKAIQNNPADRYSFKYCVQNGDNLWKISRRFYGTGTRYKDIAEWNKLSINEGIIPGDSIILK